MSLPRISFVFGFAALLSVVALPSLYAAERGAQSPASSAEPRWFKGNLRVVLRRV
jgi:hypothetical protein